MRGRYSLDDGEQSVSGVVEHGLYNLRILIVSSRADHVALPTPGYVRIAKIQADPVRFAYSLFLGRAVDLSPQVDLQSWPCRLRVGDILRLNELRWTIKGSAVSYG